jgi:hypothetical protein
VKGQAHCRRFFFWRYAIAGQTLAPKTAPALGGMPMKLNLHLPDRELDRAAGRHGRYGDVAGDFLEGHAHPCSIVTLGHDDGAYPRSEPLQVSKGSFEPPNELFSFAPGRR